MHDAIREWLGSIATTFTETLTSQIDAREGEVRSEGPPPYRRVDCDRRALVYIHLRPRKRLVRIDISGLWCVSANSKLLIRSSGGWSLLVRNEFEADTAARILRRVVEQTRERLNRENTSGRRGTTSRLHSPGGSTRSSAQGPQEHHR